MKKTLTNLTFSCTLLAASAAPLFAQDFFRRFRRPRAVPEIDASAGLLAVVAVLAVIAFVWERRRRTA
jgi:hypothetical protein